MVRREFGKERIKMKTIYFDLDGTILDVSDRLYQIYRDVITSFKCKPLSKTRYWRLKRNKISEDEIVATTCPTNVISPYLKKRNSLIEFSKYLKHDKLNPNALKTLKILKKNNRLVLIALRRSRKNLQRELKELKLSPLFDKILTSNRHEGYRSKVRLIKEDGHSDAMIIGDTEDDVLAGKNLHVKTIAVSNGMRTKKFLVSLNPDYLINSLSEALKILRKYQDWGT